MNSKFNFTGKDVFVTAGCLIFLMASLGAVGSAGREKAQESVCLSNLKQFGSAFQMWLSDHNGLFPNGHDKWMHSLAPYYGCVPKTQDASNVFQYRREYKIRFCPTAMRFGIQSAIPIEGNEGAKQPFQAWEELPQPYVESDSENKWDIYYWDGSYGSNSWFYDSINQISGVDGNWHNANVKNPGEIPLLLDSAFFGGFPREDDMLPAVPGDLVGSRARGAYMKQFMLDRHNGFTSAVFMDFSARPVGIKELYTLRWHRTFDTCNQYTCCGNFSGGGKGGSGQCRIDWGADWLNTKYKNY